MLLNIGIVLASFAFMEFMAWFTHKYIMHGLLWNLHEDHHYKEHDSKWELNDFFFIMFGLPGFLLIFFGYGDGAYDWRFWMGTGITLYGMAYVFVHDIFVHQRIKVLRRTKNTYLIALRKAHLVHHKHLGKEDGECFGFLWVPRKYLEQARASKATQN